MKRFLRAIVAAATAVTLAGCATSGEPERPDTIDTGEMRFEVNATYAVEGDAATRAVKSGWTTGDMILVYLDGSSANRVWLTYSAEGRWLAKSDGVYAPAGTAKAGGGSVSALHAYHMAGDAGPGGNEPSYDRDLLLDDGGSYTVDGSTAYVTLEMDTRLTSKISVEGVTEPDNWTLAGDDLHVIPTSATMAYDDFSASWAATTSALFTESDITTNAAAATTGYLGQNDVAVYWVTDKGDHDEAITLRLRNTATGKTWARTFTGADKDLAPGESLTITGPDETGTDGWTEWIDTDNVVAMIPDPALRAYVEDVMVNGMEYGGLAVAPWDADGDGKLSRAEAAAVLYINFPGAVTDGSGNIISELPVKVQSTSGIEHFTGLRSLWLDYHQIESIDLSALTNLVQLTVAENRISELDVSANTNLVSLSVFANPITTLDVTHLSALTVLETSYTRLTSIDLSGNPLLESLWSSGANLTELDLSHNPALTVAYVGYNELTALDISNNTLLEELLFEGNPGDGVKRMPVKAWFDDAGIPDPDNFTSFAWFLDEGTRITPVYYTGDTPPEPEPYYVSTDYSADGNVVRLQTATTGAGIDFVLMGDAFSDRLIADGTYTDRMNEAMENLFTEEPYKSLRSMFNVYAVTVVSKNEVVANDAETALDTQFGEGTWVWGDDWKVIPYALKVVSEDRMDNTSVAVIVNDDSWHGTCVMYSPDSGAPVNDYGSGLNISFFTIPNDDDEYFRQLLNHELNGHGFPKLHDEYWLDDEATIDADWIADLTEYATIGWLKNIDLTDNPATVKWAKYLSDPYYLAQGLGVFEGGLGADGFGHGVWRPTENSMMRYNDAPFNAPSREAIYYRIHKLAYGSSWVYNHAEFVAWDKAHSPVFGGVASRQAGSGVRKPVTDHSPPIILPYSWREAIDK